MYYIVFAYGNMKTKGYQGIQLEKEEVAGSLFVDDVIV